MYQSTKVPTEKKKNTIENNEKLQTIPCTMFEWFDDGDNDDDNDVSVSGICI